MDNFKKYGQYKRDIFKKLGFNFEKGKKILDVGCGDCIDTEIFMNEYGLDTYGIDIFKHGNVNKSDSLNFSIAGIYGIPHEDDCFDYVFLHDVLHHIDEKNQNYEKHKDGLTELLRVTKKGGAYNYS